MARNRATVLERQPPQMREVHEIVRVATKAHGTIYAALDDLQRDPRKDVAQAPGHGG
jgi:hypothetical protein